MKELSLNILDIAMNSVKANADTVEINLVETDDVLSIEIKDNGCGMTPEFLKTVCDPFSTTRTTRKVGMGIPFFKEEAEQTGGEFRITSRDEKTYPDSHGTVTYASFVKTHIDFTPLGDIISTVLTLIQGNEKMRWVFTHKKNNGTVELDTDELKQILGDIPLDNPEILAWIRDFLKEQYEEVK